MSLSLWSVSFLEWWPSLVADSLWPLPRDVTESWGFSLLPPLLCLQLTEPIRELVSLGNVPGGAVQSKGRSWYEIKLAHTPWTMEMHLFLLESIPHSKTKHLNSGLPLSSMRQRNTSKSIHLLQTQVSWKLGIGMWSTSQGCNYQKEECVCACLSDVAIIWILQHYC